MKQSNPWDSISVPKENVNLIRVDSGHPLDLFWGRDMAGKYLLLFSINSDTLTKPKLPKLNGIDLYFQKVPHGDKIHFAIVLNELENWELFLALCKDIVLASSSVLDAELAVKVVVRRLHRWREFLKKGNPNILSEEKIKGLLGELLFIERELDPVFSIENAVEFWQGPNDAPQDFNIRNCAVEVKCQSGTTNPMVRISSLEQLCPQLPKMYLYVVTLGRCPKEDSDSLTLPKVVKSINEKLIDSGGGLFEKFNNLLMQVGYFYTDEYNEFSYVLSDVQVYDVRDGFPRISMQNVDNGIEKVSYSISLLECENFKCNLGL